MRFLEPGGWPGGWVCGDWPSSGWRLGAEVQCDVGLSLHFPVGEGVSLCFAAWTWVKGVWCNVKVSFLPSSLCFFLCLFLFFCSTQVL